MASYILIIMSIIDIAAGFLLAAVPHSQVFLASFRITPVLANYLAGILLVKGAYSLFHGVIRSD
ncbi:MAG: hypothetical protein QF775_02265 [archaeon]|jgi:hypothetical protein|nr:hypothetical protein [Euryarchaeota archaeon]MDP6704286.1 hypothetical protein [archaeon]MDP7260386.1 hypothetical protein [archaeon]|tara:strand:+ start:1936 stop:2127 length:192 start_codon:yes stop_codon:yes gene_type:complete